MAIPITVPRLGWNMEEGQFAGWLKPDGAPVRAGEALFRLESEKATEEIECLDNGILRIPRDGPAEGDKVVVGAVIGFLVQPGEQIPSETQTPSPPESSKPRSSPRARRVARQLGVDWTRLVGTGRTGRIRERDVRAAAPAEPKVASVGSIRKIIAERMQTSHLSTAPVTLTTTADATNLVNLRGQFKSAVQAGGDLVPSYTDFLVKLSAIALGKHPLLNARWDNEQIQLSEAIHIGVAVDTEAGLLVPVLRDVPSLTLKQLAARSRELIDRARRRQLAADEMQGGNFTVTNLGAFGIDAFTPIINFPQCAILGVGRIQCRPVAIDRQVTARDQVTLSLTFDHRIVDGGPAAAFLQTLSRIIESPGPWLMP
jgi:pyruvate dehydrogenase E2 component (dihydrolipoamide acetyltransferase)